MKPSRDIVRLVMTSLMAVETPEQARIHRARQRFLITSGSAAHSGLVNGEGPEPVVAVPQPVWADPDVDDVRIMGAFRAVWVLGEVRLHTAIVVGSRRNVGGPLTLHCHLVVPADDHRHLRKGG